MSKISKIQSKQPYSNPRPIQHCNETFHLSNQKHDKKSMKKINNNIEYTPYMPKFSKLETQVLNQNLQIILII